MSPKLRCQDSQAILESNKVELASTNNGLFLTWLYMPLWIWPHLQSSLYQEHGQPEERGGKLEPSCVFLARATYNVSCIYLTGPNK